MADKVLQNHADQDGRIVERDIPLSYDPSAPAAQPSATHATAAPQPHKPPQATSTDAASNSSDTTVPADSAIRPVPVQAFQSSVPRSEIGGAALPEHRTTAPTVFITSTTATAQAAPLPLLTVGPIIGLVTDNSARVLIECNRDITVTAILTVECSQVRASATTAPQAAAAQPSEQAPTANIPPGLYPNGLNSAPGSRSLAAPDPSPANGRGSNEHAANSNGVSGHEQDGQGEKEIRLSVECKKHRAQVLKFSGLAADTRYKLTFVNVPERVPASVTTLPLGWTVNAASPLRAALVSCNMFGVTKALKDAQSDLWLDLQRRTAAGELDYIFHIGDQIYADEHRNLDDKALDENYQLVFKVGVKMLKELGVDEKGRADWPAAAEHIKELYRQLYRESWTHTPTACTLANVPNLMILDDHDFRDDWGNEPEDSDPSSVEYYVGRCAHWVMCEYQRALWDDIDFAAIADIKKDFHFHVFGEHGVIFMDIRGPRSLHRVKDDPFPYVGSPQWKEITDAVTPGGIFDSVKSLLMICPAPIVFLPTTLNDLLGNTMLDDALGHWSTKPFQPEQMKMLNLLKDWKLAVPGRELTLIGGDVHVGGHTEVSFQGKPIFQQIITSAIANHQLKRLEYFVGTFTQEYVSDLGEGWGFTHRGYTRLRNYGLLRVASDAEGVLVQRRLMTPQGEKPLADNRAGVAHLQSENEKETDKLLHPMKTGYVKGDA